jgi:hypothetical protein
LNHLPYFASPESGQTVNYERIDRDINRLGAQAIRQLFRADLLWRNVEPVDDQWQFERTDAVIKNAAAVPIVRLFSNQYASATPPWDSRQNTFRSSIGPKARDYIETVVRRYADHVRYWEIGNEMDRWASLKSGDGQKAPSPRSPHGPPGGFSAEAQGKMVSEVASIIRSIDADAVILMPAMSGLTTSVLEEWLPAFVRGAGVNGFDVVNYHEYGAWDTAESRREKLADVVRTLGINEKPIWLTETGTAREQSPMNADETQAADVFRRIVLAWAQGDQSVFWHSYMSSDKRGEARSMSFGLRRSDGAASPAFKSYRLLAVHLASFVSIHAMTGLKDGQYGFVVRRKDGTYRWVFWGRGSVEAPQDVPAKAYTSVVADEQGNHAWRGVPDRLELSEIPILLRH